MEFLTGNELNESKVPSEAIQINHDVNIFLGENATILEDNWEKKTVDRSCLTDSLELRE